jgi:hypothetical protein
VRHEQDGATSGKGPALVIDAEPGSIRITSDNAHEARRAAYDAISLPRGFAVFGTTDRRACPMATRDAREAYC